MTAGTGPLPDVDPLAVTHVEHVMGTVVSFRVLPSDEVGLDHVGQLLAEACALLHRVDSVFSTWDARSPLSELRAGVRTIEQCPPVVAEVLERCSTAKVWSNGWFDPWAMPGGIDPTGLVKGWAADGALAVLRQPAVDAALVNAGGDVVGFGCPSPGARWRVGIRHPWRADALACVVHLDGAVATSATYERGAHLIDPHTGENRARAASATVCGPTLAMADALATGLAVGGDPVMAAIDALTGYEAYLVRPDGSEASTPGMPFAD